MNMARRSPGTVSYRGRVYAVGGMGVEEDLSSVEVLSPGAAEWRLLEDGMKEVNGWCSACLVDKPLRMMRTERSLTFRQKGSCGVEWEGEESGAATPASAGDSRRNWNWGGRAGGSTHTGLRTRAVTRVEMFPAKTLGEPSLPLDGSSVFPFLLFGAALASLVLVTHPSSPDEPSTVLLSYLRRHAD